jgi:hypothetical protein|tara:strand:+ start:193 stop:399 length:207 start_codon:yes stop_codon:yes gene_type:complete
MNTLNTKDIKSILDAMNEGRQMYKKSKKYKGRDVYESLNPDTRKLMGLPTLEQLGFSNRPSETLGGTK